MNSTNSLNIAFHLPKMANEIPYQRAIVFPEGRDKLGNVSYTHLTYKQLNEASDKYAWGFQKLGIKRGTKTLLLVKQSLEFISLTFALFKLGAVPILIDPGMGRKRLLQCIGEVEPEAFIGIPKAHIARLLYPKYFHNVKYYVTVGKKWLPWSGKTLEEIVSIDKNNETKSFPIAPIKADEMAAILFTSGSTGIAKGVVYTHKIFNEQVKVLRNLYDIKVGEVDLAGLAVFALFDVAMGMTCVIPDMDPTKPAQVNPKKIIEAIKNQGVTFTFGSPAIWNRVGLYCIENNIKLPSIKRIMMAGAPIPSSVLERFKKHILNDDAEIYTPYGATEALPTASISATERLTETDEKTKKGLGTCVGYPAPNITIKIIKIDEEIIPKWYDNLTLPIGEIGEICVKGDVVTPSYYNKPEATRLAKIYDGDEIWHRIGDVGYLDEKGRLWFCGRKAHRVETANGILFSVCCEAIFNEHPKVFRSALVGIKDNKNEQKPIIIIETEQGQMPTSEDEKVRFIKELLALARNNEITKDIDTFLFHSSFPVDIRHNAKIFREKLAVWAEKQS